MAVQTPPRPELAHAQAIRADFPEVVSALREVVGRGLVAYLGGVKETRAVNQWAAGDREPGAKVKARLRLALQIALMVADADGPRVAQAWFQGLNPQLDDRSPARVLRVGDLERDGQAVLGAARAFLVGG
jgi:hypothetical protein